MVLGVAKRCRCLYLGFELLVLYSLSWRIGHVKYNGVPALFGMQVEYFGTRVLN